MSERFPAPSKDEVQLMNRVIADAKPDLEGFQLLAGHDQVSWTVEDFAIWMAIMRENGINEESQGWTDVMHSSLLERIARDGPVFEDAPPLRNAYPWVTLCTNGWDVVDVQDSGRDSIVVEDQSRWEVVERYASNGRPAWRVRSGHWVAKIEWEHGPFDVGDRVRPAPTEAFVIRLDKPASMIDIQKIKSKWKGRRERQQNKQERNVGGGAAHQASHRRARSAQRSRQ